MSAACLHQSLARDYWQLETRPSDEQRYNLYCATCTTCGTTRAIVEVWAQTHGERSEHERRIAENMAGEAARRARVAAKRVRAA